MCTLIDPLSIHTLCIISHLIISLKLHTSIHHPLVCNVENVDFFTVTPGTTWKLRIDTSWFTHSGLRVLLHIFDVTNLSVLWLVSAITIWEKKSKKLITQVWANPSLSVDWLKVAFETLKQISTHSKSATTKKLNLNGVSAHVCSLGHTLELGFATEPTSFCHVRIRKSFSRLNTRASYLHISA